MGTICSTHKASISVAFVFVRSNMKIWIDADACPRVVKEILFRASSRLQVGLCLVANKSLAKHNGPLVETIVVDDGFDVADDYIAEHAAATDLVVTADVPLAARIVAKGVSPWTRVVSSTLKNPSATGWPFAT